MNTPESHESYMRRALELARCGLGATRPNPVVGAVVVREGEIVGEGFHAYAGGPHAEVEAIRHAAEAAEGTTMYVTLEPCNHHGRTPPCTGAILEAGIARVYYAAPDTNPGVEGGGGEFLRSHGIPCNEGPLTDEAILLNRGYFHWTHTGRPWVIAKFAASLDGRIATRTGESQWITGPEARRRGHELRQEVDAILVGVGTVLADDPLLTARLGDVDGRTGVDGIVRVVMDSHGRSSLGSRVFAHAGGAVTLVATTESSPQAWREGLRKRDVDVVVAPSDRDERVDPVALLDELGRREVRSLLVEGGPTVHGAFFDAGLVNEVWVFLAPIVIGGVDAPGAVGGLGAAALRDALRLESVQVETCGSDVLVRGFVLHSRPGFAPMGTGSAAQVLRRDGRHDGLSTEPVKTI